MFLNTLEGGFDYRKDKTFLAYSFYSSNYFSNVICFRLYSKST